MGTRSVRTADSLCATTRFMGELGEFKAPKSHRGNKTDVPDVFADF